MRSDTDAVTIHVASWNTRAVTELCVRSMRRTAGYEFNLTVGDGGSTDGSVMLLENLAARGWLKLECVEGGRTHAEWLDHWYNSCQTRYLIFSDSDVLYRRKGWLREMVERAASSNAAMVATRVQARNGVAYVHPVTGAKRTLAARPEPWLVLIDLHQTRGVVTTSFAYEDGGDPGDGSDQIAYDVSAAFFRDFETAGLRAEEMGPGFASAYHHFGGMTWLSGKDSRISWARRAKQIAKKLYSTAALLRERLASR